MLMAIMLLIIISTIMAVSISMSTTTTARTTNEYLHEQAILLASSATEYAVLAISGHNRINNCINSMNAVYPSVANPMFDINITMQYIGFGTVGVNADDCIDYPGLGNITTPETNGTVLMDVTVTSSNELNLTEPIRYERRTLQKL